MFVREKITKDSTINADGTVTTKLSIDYKIHIREAIAVWKAAGFA